MTNTVPSQFPFESKYIEVLGAKLHYIDEGEGDPVLFLHGVPTSSYLWRNVIPPLLATSRCIAVDLIGFGHSDKPNIAYTIFDHIRYITAFIQQLGLRNLTVVCHGWGSLVGLNFATHHPELIKAVAFYESHIRNPNHPDTASLPLQDLASILTRPDGGYNVIMNTNYYINRVFPSGILRNLTPEELAIYQAPFQTPQSRKPIWQYLQELPLGTEKNEITDLIDDYSSRLCHLNFPKLFIYGIPGFVTTIDTIIWARDNMPNLQLADVGDALHYIQESNPSIIANALKEWIYSLEKTAEFA